MELLSALLVVLVLSHCLELLLVLFVNLVLSPIQLDFVNHVLQTLILLKVVH